KVGPGVSNEEAGASLRGPVPRHQERLVEARLGSPRLRLPVVAPAHQRRQRHQDRLRAPAGLEAEERAPVPHQVELHITAPPVELEVPLPLAVGGVPAPLDDGHIGGEEVVADALEEGEAALEPPLVEIVEKDPADPSRLLAVAEVEVFVAPRLVARVDLRTERRARLAGGAVPVDGVLLEAIVGREVEPAAEPPDGRLALLLGDEEADVHVRRGHVGIERMEDEGDAERLEAAPRELRPVNGGRRRKPRAEDMGETDPRLLEDRAAGENPRPAAAALRPLP